MDFKSISDKKPQIAIAFVCVAILALVYVMWPSGPITVTKAFFTTDDGKTYFRDDAELIPPCQIGGKTAVFAYVWRCPTCGKEFVGSLGRFRADRIEAVKQARAEAKIKPDPTKPPKMAPEVTESQVESKRPGEPESAWKIPARPDMATAMAEAASNKVAAGFPHCPDHPTVMAEPILP